ncbi:MAG: TonB-dependent receptor [Sphingomonadales bacterium]|nr:TonB-dependent receptor [Sphingomonadales bacterium]
MPSASTSVTFSKYAKNTFRGSVSSQALILSLTSVLIGGSHVSAQQVASSDDNLNVEEVIVTGSRRAARSAADVPAPVDVIGVEQLTQQGSSDTSDLLRTIIPSLNIGDNPLSGTSTSIRPATLRGLSPDHALVLVNGKRRHRAADIATFSGGITDGSQGPDLSNIPAIAIKQVQVLRDGAAAQYGSDAIAGVINFIMSDEREGGRLEAKVGSTYEGDGDNYQVAGTWGTPLGESGFVRFSGEFRENDLTTRAVQRGDAAALIAAGNTDVPDPATRFGTPKISDDIKTFVNLAVEAGENSEFYAFGGYASRRTQSDFFYRNPEGRFGVFTDNDDGGNFLIGDMTPNDGVTCDGGIDFGGTGVVNDPIAVGSADAAARLTAIFADPNCFSALEVFPGGYTPFFGSHVTDVSGAFGLRGKFDNGLTYDISLNAGRSKIKFDVSNVLNPSMGSLSPTDFNDIGTRVQSERNFNADFSYGVDVGFASPLNIAAGVEWRRERFEIVTGEPSSFEPGVLGDQGFLIGEEALPGFSPSIAGAFSRSNKSIYLDLEADVIEDLVIGAAVRYEDFTDFGSKTTYKVSGLYHVTNEFGIRSTYATGFHAPTPGQQNFSALTTEINAEGSLIESGVIPPTSPVAMAVGGSQLQPETSKSFTVGAVYGTNWINVTLDFYVIKMDDRITQSASHVLTDEQRAELIAEGFFAAGGLGTFRFFTNDFSSTTKGIDLVASMPIELTSTGTSEISLAVNWTKTNVTSFDPTDPDELLSQTRVTQLEKNNPRWRGNITFIHNEDRWRGLVRVNYYGKFTELHVNAGSLRIDAGSEITVDTEVGVYVLQDVEFVVGAQNLFNNFPDRNPWDFIVGSKYPTTSPSGINGGMYYAKLRYAF